jgi:hypothetical protein
VIAWFAAKPVWKQITLVSVQTAVALHGAMSARANLLSARADARLKKFADSLSLGYHEREGTAALTHWVWDMESITRDEVSFLQFQQMENLDGDEATAARTSLIRCLELLAQSLWDFNREVHLGYSEGEIDITPELRAQVDVAERQAKLDLPARITAVLDATCTLRAAFDRDLDQIRLKRQILDETLVKGSVQ